MINYPIEDIRSVKITVTYDIKGGGSGANDFNTLQELKQWLDKHPSLAEKLGYTKGK